MALMFSKACQYALQAAIFLAAQPVDRPVLQRDIATALDLPQPFLGKVLLLLSRWGLVRSHKGRYGGYVLNQPAGRISLYDIVEAIDGPFFLECCVLGFPGCNDESPCPVHPHWKQAKEIILGMLEDTTLEELSSGVEPKLDLIEKLRSSKHEARQKGAGSLEG